MRNAAGAQPANSGWETTRYAERSGALDALVGEWQRFGQFANRETFIHKRFEYGLGGIYILGRTLDMFPPAEPSPDFEVHQDLMVFYRDHATGKLKLKIFFVEGYVTSEEISVSPDGKTLVAETTAIENGPPGMRTRNTIVFESPDRWRQRFEVAMPGGDYTMLEELTLKRVSVPE